MTPLDSQEFESYVPVYDTVPETWEDARPFLVEHLKKISNGINIRTIGWLLDEELLSGQAFIPGTAENPANSVPLQYRSVLRKVIDFGPLPNTGVKNVPHGIVFDANFTLIHMWASATDPTNFVAITIPYATATATNIEMYMNATDIYIITQSNRSNFTRCFVFIEYIQEL